MTSPTGRSTERPAARAQRWLRRLTTTVTATTAGGVLLAGGPVTSPDTATAEPSLDATEAALSLAAADPHRWPGHPGRKVVRYRVKPGDTATGLAVRFHAWTDELRAINHLSRHATLYVGEHIRIPVVLSALRKHHRHAKAARRTHHRAQAPRHRTRHSPSRAHARPARPWALADVSRGKVRRVVVRTAQQHGVDPELALAVAWQESGWQQRRISSAGAIGAMQVLPGTAQWMSLYAGRPLNPYGLYDNVTAGVVLIKVLRSQTGPRKAVAAYYQGLGSVQDHGMYPSTKRYVKNVVYLRKLLESGWNPA